MPRRHGKKARAKHKFAATKGVVMRTGGNNVGWYRSDDIEYPEADKAYAFPERKTANVIDSKGRV